MSVMLEPVRSEGETSVGRILLAEDDAALRTLLSFALESDGYEVIEAEDGARLFGYLRSVGHLDAVIADVMMPGPSGVEALGRFRRFDRSTPFVLITAFGTEELHEEAHAMGATAVFDKPFDLDDLRFLMRRLAPLEEPKNSIYPKEDM
jgi:CheY-like chemotaxis protein